MFCVFACSPIPPKRVNRLRRNLRKDFLGSEDGSKSKKNLKPEKMVLRWYLNLYFTQMLL